MRKNGSRLSRLPLAIAVIAALSITPAFAQSQQTADSSANQSTNNSQSTDQAQTKTAKTSQTAKQKATDLQAMTVTGSLLKHPEYQDTVPVQVINVEVQKAAGDFSVANFVQTTAAAGGSTQINNQFNGFVVSGGTGVQTISLRGMGANRTLVLLDGQRPGPAGTRGQVGAFDLNVIPSAIIQNIEVVKDGTSSIYGSDAIAGVVNLITKKRLDHTVFDFYAGIPQHGGGQQYSASGATGFNFSNGNITLAFQSDKQKALTYGDRDFLSCNRDRVWGKDGKRIDRADHSINQGTPMEGCDNLLNNVIITGFAAPYDRLVATKDGGYDPTLGPGYFPKGFGQWIHTTYADTTTPSDNEPTDFAQWKNAYAINESSHQSAWASSSFSFGSVGWDTQLLYTRRETRQKNWRQFFPVQYYNSPNLGPVVMEPVMLFPMNQQIAVDYFYGHTKLGGIFTNSDSWSWEVNANYSHSSGDYNTVGISVANSADLSNPDNKLSTPLIDYFDKDVINGNKMGALVNAVGQFLHGNTVYEQKDVNVVFNGDLFELPYGPVSSAIGAEWRQYSILDNPPPGSWGLTSAGITKGEDTDKEAFAEIGIPVLKGLPGVNSLALDLSGRVFRYDSVGSTSHVWKAGLNWQIVPTFRVRASLGTSYRAPGLYELYLNNQTGFLSQTAIDPCIQWGTSTSTRIKTNCAAAGIPDNYNGGNPAGGGPYSSALSSLSGGKGVLKPETSRSKSVGIVWSPLNGNFNMSLDYFDYHVKGEIASLSGSSILSACYGLAVSPNRYCDMFHRNGANDTNPYMITEIDGSYVNINSERNRGYDFEANYDGDYSFGHLFAGAQFTYTIEDTQQLFDSAEESGFTDTNYAGSIGDPKLYGLAHVGLKKGNWTFQWQGLYTSSTEVKDYGNIHSYFGYEGAAYDIKAEWQIRHNVSVTYNQPKWQLMFGIRNLFDKQPDVVSSGMDNEAGNVPLSSSQYDWYGRTFFARFELKL
ncbi:MAG TPA: TonB-dependent receptor [Rhodanobacteraceae bacterium]